MQSDCVELSLSFVVSDSHTQPRLKHAPFTSAPLYTYVSLIVCFAIDDHRESRVSPLVPIRLVRGRPLALDSLSTRMLKLPNRLTCQSGSMKTRFSTSVHASCIASDRGGPLPPLTGGQDSIHSGRPVHGSKTQVQLVNEQETVLFVRCRSAACGARRLVSRC